MSRLDDATAKANRLAAMQEAATSLEEQRNERVRLRDAEIAAEEERLRKSKDGEHRFLSSVRNKASDMNIGDALSRGRQGMRTEVNV